MKTQTEKITQKVENEKSIKDNLEIIHSLNDLLYNGSLYWCKVTQKKDLWKLISYGPFFIISLDRLFFHHILYIWLALELSVL